MLLSLPNDDGSPNEAAAFALAVCINGIYKNERGPLLDYADYTGTQLVDFAHAPATFEPDRAVLAAGSEVQVLFAGTTNTAQWLGHIQGALYPLPDLTVPLPGDRNPQACGSFLRGLDTIASTIDPFTRGKDRVLIAGHSYGGGAGHMYARRIANRLVRPTTVELLTFGEPKGYDAARALSEPDYHARIINRRDVVPFASQLVGVDPVTLTPPNMVTLNRLGVRTRWLPNTLGLLWAHHGNPWLLSGIELVSGAANGFVDGLVLDMELHTFAANLTNASLHYIGAGYMVNARAAWERSGKEPGLAVLLPWYTIFLNDPYVPPPRLLPAVDAAILNQSFFPAGDDPVTDADRGDWEQVSAVGSFVPLNGGGGRMTVMRGSMLMGIMKQGYSETFHAADNTTSYAQMQTKLAQILPKRFALSCSEKDKADLADRNSLGIVAFRISDDANPRSTLNVGVETPAGWNGTEGNMDGQLAAKIIWRAQNMTQIAVTYLHGVPDQAIEEVNEVFRTAVFTGPYKTKLTAYCNELRNRGLGFQSLNLAPANAVGAITAVAYDAASGFFSLTTTLGVPQGKFRCRLAGFKSLRGLNGRQSCQATGASQFKVFKRLASGTWDGTGTAIPLSGYNANVFFNNYVTKVPETAEATIITAKKLGRPFFLQHGRVSRRAA